MNAEFRSTFNQAKQNMLIKQIREQFMVDDAILKLFSEIPREYFVPKTYKSMAYAEFNVDIGHGQVMMTPNEEARMLQALRPRPQDNVLEIGTGTGFVTALLAKSSKHVMSIDIFPEFSEAAAAHLNTLAIDINNVNFITKDAAKGFASEKSYDVICITASMPLIPESYLQNLTINGRLFAIVGKSPAKTATLITRTSQDRWQQETLFETDLPEMINAVKPEPFVF